MIGRVPVGVIADVTLGKMLQPRPNKPQDVLRPYLRAAHVQPNGVLDLGVELKEMWFAVDELDGLGIRAGDVLVVEGGAVGRSTYIASDMPEVGFQNALLRVRPRKTKADGRYLNYSLQSAVLSGEVATFCDSVSIPHFTAEKVARFRVPYHDIHTQRRIADYLDRETGEIDAMLAKMDELTATLEARRTAVIDHELSPLLLAPLESGWTVTDCMHTTATFVDEGENFVVSIGQLDGTSVDTTTSPRTTDAEFAYLRSGGRAPKPGDAVMSRNASVGKLALVTPGNPPFALGQDVVLLSPFGNENARLLAYSMATTRTRESLDLMMQGTTFKRINVASIRKLPWVHLDDLEQLRIADHLDEATGKIDQMLAKTAELRSLLVERRSALITDVVTGNKQVHS